nr:unnamed protein product [Callosobruchus analis]
MSQVKRMIRLMQWNARSAVANKLSLDKFLHDNQIDIALISETWFKPNINIRFKEYSIIRRDRHDGKTGVAIFVRNTLNFEEITSPLQSDDIQVCGAEISIADSLHLSLLSVYVPPGTNIFPNNWARLLTLSNQHAIIGGDFNAHHGLWGSYKQNHNGVSLVEALNSADLVLLNDGSPTRFQNNENNSVVDLTFASPDIANIIEWRTHDDTLGSDHYPILLEIKLQSASNGHVITPKNKWNTDKANWNLYHHYCDNFFNNCPPAFQNTDEKYQFFIQGINEAALKSIPPYKPFTKKNSAPAPWWDQECEEAINNRKREFRKYKQQSNVENYVFCKREIAKTKRILKNKAKLYWIKYCNNLNKNTPCSDLWSQAKRMQRMQVNYNKCNNLDWEEHFFNKIAPCSTTQDSADMFLRQDCNTSSFLSQHITINELEYALRNANNSSPGLDNITYSMIWHLPLNGKQLLLELYNDVWLENKDIEDWRKIIVVAVRKPGKDPNLCESYRPISLLSCVFKTLERIIKQRLEWFLISRNLLPTSQFGFRKGYGTMDAVACIVTDIQICFSRNTYLGAAFLDVKGAYDYVDLFILKSKLEKLHIPTNNCRTIIKFFLKRMIFLRSSANSLLGPREISMGLPQGLVLSPVLFNIYTMEIHSSDLNCNLIQYADDLAIYIENKNYNTCKDTLANSISSVTSQLTSLGFCLSPQKSTIVFFSRHNLPQIDHVDIMDSEFPVSGTVEYLGVVLDKKLSWSPFIEKIILKCQKGINFLKMIRRTWWGADPEVALTFYRAYIRSIIDYGCIFYGSASKSALKKLDVLQNNALRLCLGAMKSTPVEPLRIESLEYPLKIRRELIASKFILKNRVKQNELSTRIVELNVNDLTNKYWIKKQSPPLCSAFRSTAEQELRLEQFEVPKETSNFFHMLSKQEIITPEFNQNVPNVSSSTLSETLDQFQNYELIFTDASKSNEGTGCAFYVASNGTSKMFKLSESTSIFSAEAIGILKAIEYVEEKSMLKTVILSLSFCFKIIF